MGQMKQGILCEKDLHNGQVYRMVTSSGLLCSMGHDLE